MTRTSSSSASSAPSRFDLREIYRPIERELATATDTLRARLGGGDATLDGYLDYTFQLGGKRLRPALLLLAAQSWGGVERRCYLCAAALEMIHTGSLVHDDILDGARFRRQLETVNTKWDSHRAVLIGDLLITRAFDLICECDDSVIFQKVSQYCQATVEGELFQTDAIGNFELTVDDYRRIVGGKTASLIECATFLGGYLAGARDAELDDFARFGRTIGMAFQIVDDALDLIGDERTVGKTLGSDLANQKETLPLIHYFQSASSGEAAALRARLANGVTNADRTEIAELLRDAGAVEASYADAEALIADSLELLTSLEERGRKLGRPVNGDSFASLASLAQFVVQRNK